jgi:2-dehydro-3-deoxygluconokinase
VSEQPSPRFEVTSLGEGQLRLSVPAGTRLEQADNFTVNVSGTEANVLATLSRLGWHCGWFSALPDTPLGRRVAGAFHDAGLDLSAVKWSHDHRLATYYVEYAVPPRSTQVYYDRANTCFTNLTPADIDWDYLLDTRILHLSGLTVPLCHNIRLIMADAITRAKERGLLVSFDMNYRSRLWSAEQARDTITPMLEHLDLLFCSKRDADTVFGITGSPEEVLRGLGELTHASHIVTSMSSEGMAGWNRQTFYRQAARDVTVLDRIGAGDAMVAGVLHGVLQGDFERGLAYGALTAALALSQYGDQPVTTPAELEALLSSSATDIVR